MVRRLAIVLSAATAFLVIGAGPAFAQTASGNFVGVWRILGAVSAAGAIVALGVVLFGPGARIEGDIRRRLGAYGSEIEAQQGFLRRIPLLRRFVSGAEDAAKRRGLFSVIETALEQADIPLQPGEAIAAVVAFAMLVGVGTGIVTQSWWWVAAAFFLSILIALTLIQSVARRERRRFADQLPDTLNLIATSLRAGYSLMQSIEAVGAESSEPTAREFGRAISEIRLGRTPSETLTDVAERMNSTDFEWAVMAISIQREVGGNLAEVLQTTSETMLQRNRLRREVRALTAEGRVSAIVLGVLPFGLFAYLWISNRSYIQPLLDSNWGVASLIGAVALVSTGVLWLTRLVRVDV